MLKTLKFCYTIGTDPALRPTALKVALVIESLLFAINHGSAVLRREITHEGWLMGLLGYSLTWCFIRSVFVDSTQPDRNTELALPAEDSNVGVSENPFDASRAIKQHILIGLKKIGLALKSQSGRMLDNKA
ncbi:nitrate/nitrite transporter NrtS [Nostoc sp. CHAB 5784]|uniref:nitrate/nitrite transporter NrtS n=1 Tax=Nostoc mirabile TaxID=2907820 RepID=UPI001E5D05AC|nr:nitrate/nitrite transporter NrtS [Nostoc mirabile]MCC5670833.1 nitrate/nitrite transporter NrtS [Nostoc mirabile CHAB5784]